MKLILFIILILIAAFQLYAQPDKFIRKGNSSYKDGNFQQAELEYRKALGKDPESKKADYNLGNALYKQKQFDAAASRYTELAKKDSDKERLNRDYYNLGNAMYESKKYSESIEAYKHALRSKPSDMDAKHNLQLALRKLSEQKQQQQQNQNQNQKNKGDNKNNKQGNQEKNNSDQDKGNQNPKNQKDNQSKNDSPQSQQAREGQINMEEADRILQALENDEKEVLKKVQDRKEQVKKIPVEKNW